MAGEYLFCFAAMTFGCGFFAGMIVGILLHKDVISD